MLQVPRSLNIPLYHTYHIHLSTPLSLPSHPAVPGTVPAWTATGGAGVSLPISYRHWEPPQVQGYQNPLLPCLFLFQLGWLNWHATLTVFTLWRVYASAWESEVFLTTVVIFLSSSGFVLSRWYETGTNYHALITYLSIYLSVCLSALSLLNDDHYCCCCCCWSWDIQHGFVLICLCVSIVYHIVFWYVILD